MGSNLEKNSPDRLRLAPGWVRRNLGYPIPKEKRKVGYESHPLMCKTITIPVLTIHTHGMKNTDTILSSEITEGSEENRMGYETTPAATPCLLNLTISEFL